jgi:hypothetical protein
MDGQNDFNTVSNVSTLQTTGTLIFWGKKTSVRSDYRIKTKEE